MSIGHTRCTVAGYFGLQKMKVRSSDLDPMKQVVTAVNESSQVIEAVPFSWPWKEWDLFCSEHFRPIRGITKFHHFRVENTKPSIVFMKVGVHDVEEEFQLLKDNVTVEQVIEAGLPQQLQPGGISEHENPLRGCALFSKFGICKTRGIALFFRQKLKFDKFDPMYGFLSKGLKWRCNSERQELQF